MTDTDRTERTEPAKDPPATGSRRGSLTVYAAAFSLMLASAVVVTVASLGSLRSTRLLWLSAALSVAAIVVAVVSLALPRR